MGYATAQVRANDLHQHLKRSPPVLAGQVVPVVESYDYLGVTVTRQLDLGAVAKYRLGKAKKAVYKIRPLL